MYMGIIKSYHKDNFKLERDDHFTYLRLAYSISLKGYGILMLICVAQILSYKIIMVKAEKHNDTNANGSKGETQGEQYQVEQAVVDQCKNVICLVTRSYTNFLLTIILNLDHFFL